MRVVFDTSVLISYLLTHRPPIATLIDHYLARGDILMVTASALTFGRLMRLSPALGMQVSQTLQARRGRAWERDKDVLARIERAETPEALVDLLPHLGGLSGPSWLARVKAFSPQIIPLLAERLKAVHTIRDEDEREMRYEHLTDAFYVCGSEAAPALLACFDELGDDEYGKSQVAMVLG